jgi:hypothetical protein
MVGVLIWVLMLILVAGYEMVWYAMERRDESLNETVGMLQNSHVDEGHGDHIIFTTYRVTLQCGVHERRRLWGECAVCGVRRWQAGFQCRPWRERGIVGVVHTLML